MYTPPQSGQKKLFCSKKKAHTYTSIPGRAIIGGLDENTLSHLAYGGQFTEVPRQVGQRLDLPARYRRKRREIASVTLV